MPGTERVHQGAFSNFVSIKMWARRTYYRASAFNNAKFLQFPKLLQATSVLHKTPLDSTLMNGRRLLCFQSFGPATPKVLRRFTISDSHSAGHRHDTLGVHLFGPGITTYPITSRKESRVSELLPFYQLFENCLQQSNVSASSGRARLWLPL